MPVWKQLQAVCPALFPLSCSMGPLVWPNCMATKTLGGFPLSQLCLCRFPASSVLSRAMAEGMMEWRPLKILSSAKTMRTVAKISRIDFFRTQKINQRLAATGECLLEKKKKKTDSQSERWALWCCNLSDSHPQFHSSLENQQPAISVKTSSLDPIPTPGRLPGRPHSQDLSLLDLTRSLPSAVFSAFSMFLEQIRHTFISELSLLHGVSRPCHPNISPPLTYLIPPSSSCSNVTLSMRVTHSCVSLTTLL